jgi:UDP-glucuronate 4-epimerase
MNLEDREQLMPLFEKENFDVVCNLAAQAGVRYSIENPHSYISSNIVGFMNVLEVCRHNKIQHLVYASSSSVYGNSDKMPLSVTDPVDNPISLYAATKKSNELMAHTYSHLFNIRTTGLRFFTVYGPWGRPDMAPILFANAISNNKPIKVFNNSNLERDFTYIDDIIEGVVRVIDSPPKTKQVSNHDNHDNPITPSDRVIRPGSILPPSAPYALYNIGNGNPIKLMDFITTLENILGKKSIKEFLPMQPGDVFKTFADVQAMKNDFGYSPNTPLNMGIEEFIHWFKAYYQK